MKKVWKVILSAILLIGLAGAGTAYYFLKVKTYDVADEELEEVTESEYEIMLPGDSGTDDSDSDNNGGEGSGTAESDENSETAAAESNGSKDGSTGSDSAGESSETSTDSAGDSSKTSTDTADSTGSTAGSGSSAAGQAGGGTSSETDSAEVTIGSIKEKYRPSFEHLQSQADAKVNALVSRAASEYAEKKQNGEKISVAYFYQKYSSAGSDLESKTDAAFQTIYGALQNDLKKNGFSPSHAEDFQKEYKSAKEARESALISKAKEAL